MTNPWKALDKSDQHMMIGSVLVPLVLWWILTGRHKYGMRGVGK